MESRILFSAHLASRAVDTRLHPQETQVLAPSRESEKDDLKLNVQKTKIMASGPIISWQMFTPHCTQGGPSENIWSMSVVPSWGLGETPIRVAEECVSSGAPFL